jgi:hypothetical protein
VELLGLQQGSSSNHLIKMLTKMNQKKALDLIERGEGEKQPEL